MVANAHSKQVMDLVCEGPADFRVHSSVYTDQAIFDQEMRDIFENGWVYVAHESEIANPGDYVTRRIGTQPVIVTRGRQEQVNVLLNVCRHRANAICREQQGDATFSFRCPYHAWTYANTGELLGVADRTRYPKGFGDDLKPAQKQPKLALIRVLSSPASMPMCPTWMTIWQASSLKSTFGPTVAWKAATPCCFPIAMGTPATGSSKPKNGVGRLPCFLCT